MTDPYRAVGEAIRAKRRSLGLTLEQLEAASGVRASFIGQIERGDKKGSLDSIARIAQGLGVPTSALFKNGGKSAGGSDDGRLLAVLRGHPPHEKALLFSTLLHLSGRLRALRRSRA